MKIVNITGGLGNQMFQYAFALFLQKKYPEENIYVDTQHYGHLFFKRFRGANLHNGFEINDVFINANLPIAKPKQIMKVSYWIPNYVLSRIGRRFLPVRKTEYISATSMNYSYDKKAINQRGDCYYEGYWQCYHYYNEMRDELNKVFAHTEPNPYNKELIERIRSSNSVGIHVRRGDYLSEPEFKGICGLEYYKEAISRVLINGQRRFFFIFTNDSAWCKDNLLPLLNGQSVEIITKNTGLSSCWDLFLMTYCKELIIANSSFSWWGAFLNTNASRVFCPKPWLNRDCELDIYCPSWILINV